MNRHINKISNYAMVGGLSAVALVGLQGCGDAGQAPEQPKEQPAQEQSVVKEGASVTIEKQADGSYKIIDEFPSTTTRVIVKEDGAERILTQEEIDKLVAEEEAKVEAGTSKLTQDPAQVSESGGMGLAGTLMASMAAGMVGAMLMNKLMNNQNYKQNQRASHKSASSYNRSQKAQATNNAARKSAGSSKKSGFFGNNKKASSSSRSSSFGG
ncbi:MAG: Unknown protein [uncultured Sulfurovum sp.]|uniref:UPF0323 domain-containing protein n=1 Tax=uncultured Sulfurovum sp. TaxID=269237 RepID=A0A6S6SUY2_9BACT|nr:MAG: Unknown protein [uncultured Sulfurovum sp.]